MPDVTVSFTDAQWARVVAASEYIKGKENDVVIDAAYLATKWKKKIETAVIEAESKQTPDSWE